MDDEGMPYNVLPRPEEAAAVIGAGGVDHVQRRFLSAGRILVAAGWLVLSTYYPAVGDRTANAEHAFVGLALLLLGAFMIMVAPVATQFHAAARAAAAVADAVLSYFLVPGGIE